MASSFHESEQAYFGFTDMVGFKDFVVFVLMCAPGRFPKEDWRTPDEQMNLDRAFVGLRYGLNLLEQTLTRHRLLHECRNLVDAAYVEYRAGRELAGQRKLEELEVLLNSVPSR